MEPFRVECPHCQKPYRVAADQANRRIKCRACGEPFIATPPENTADPLDPPTLDFDIEPDAPPQTQSPYQPSTYQPVANQPAAYPPNAGAAAAPTYAAPTYGATSFKPPIMSGEKQGNVCAVLSLVFGLALCVPLASVAALVLGIIGLRKSKSRGGAGEGISIAGIVLGAVFTLVLPTILIPSLRRAKPVADRVKCIANLRSISQGLANYGHDNHRYPPDLKALIQSEGLVDYALICPDDPNQSLGDRPSGSYILLVPNRDIRSVGAGQPIVAEPLADHGDGVNVLFADGRILWIPAAEVPNLVPQAIDPTAADSNLTPQNDSQPNPQNASPQNASPQMAREVPFPHPPHPPHMFWRTPRSGSGDRLDLPSHDAAAVQFQNIENSWHILGSSADLLHELHGSVPPDDDGTILLSPGQSTATTSHFKPPVTFQIVLLTNDNDTRISYAADQIIFNWEMDKTQIRVDGGPASGKYKQGVGELPPDQWSGIELSVTPSAMIIDVNGKEIYNVDGDFTSIDQPFSIAAHQGFVKVHSLKVIGTPDPQ